MKLTLGTETTALPHFMVTGVPEVSADWELLMAENTAY